MPFTPYSEHVTIKLLRIDRASGQLALILKGPPGAHIGKHKHYGSVTLYTISGAWRYLEHDWVARAGDFVFETASSSHTFVTEGDEMVEVFVVVEGALEFLTRTATRSASRTGSRCIAATSTTAVSKGSSRLTSPS